MKKTSKKIEMPKQVFTTVSTEVDAILEELVQWTIDKSDKNLKLEDLKLKQDNDEEK